jgi:hypothetical protein
MRRRNRLVACSRNKGGRALPVPWGLIVRALLAVELAEDACRLLLVSMTSRLAPSTRVAGSSSLGARHSKGFWYTRRHGAYRDVLIVASRALLPQAKTKGQSLTLSFELSSDQTSRLLNIEHDLMEIY